MTYEESTLLGKVITRQATPEELAIFDNIKPMEMTCLDRERYRKKKLEEGTK